MGTVNDMIVEMSEKIKTMKATRDLAIIIATRALHEWEGEKDSDILFGALDEITSLDIPLYEKTMSEIEKENEAGTED